MRNAEFVEVVQVRYTKVQRCQEDDLLAGEVPQDMEWDDKGPPDEFFTDRTLR